MKHFFSLISNCNFCYLTLVIINILTFCFKGIVYSLVNFDKVYTAVYNQDVTYTGIHTFVGDVDYGGTYTGIGNYGVAGFAKNYEKHWVKDYSKQYDAEYTKRWEKNYVKTYTKIWEKDYETNYEGDYLVFC